MRGTRQHSFRRLAAGAVSVLMLSAGVAGCGDAADDPGVTVGEIQQDEPDNAVDPSGEHLAPFDDEFYQAVESYDGQHVTVTGRVDDIVSDNAFTIVGVEDSGTEPLLVVHADPVDGLSGDAVVEVTGTVHKTLDLPQVEDDLGAELGPEVESWVEEPYLDAEAVRTGVSVED